MDYPATNRELLREIVDRGTVVSEYPPGVPAEPFRFPARNRVIAGLSIGVVIVEGVERSGTRSTADFASQVGIDVFGVPGAVTSALSEAPNALIRDGARLIRSSTDLLHDLGVDPGARLVTPEGLSPIQTAVLAALERPMMAEEVSLATGLGYPGCGLGADQPRDPQPGHRRRRPLPAGRRAGSGSGATRTGVGPPRDPRRSRRLPGPRPMAGDAHPGDCVTPGALGRYALAAAGPAGVPGEDPCRPHLAIARSPHPSGR